MCFWCFCLLFFEKLRLQIIRWSQTAAARGRERQAATAAFHACGSSRWPLGDCAKAAIFEKDHEFNSTQLGYWKLNPKSCASCWVNSKVVCHIVGLVAVSLCAFPLCILVVLEYSLQCGAMCHYDPLGERGMKLDEPGKSSLTTQSMTTLSPKSGSLRVNPLFGGSPPYRGGPRLPIKRKRSVPGLDVTMIFSWLDALTRWKQN